MKTDLTEVVLDEVLTDMDTFGDWLCGALMQREVDEASCNKLGFYLLYGPVANVTAAPLADLLYVVMTDDDPDVVMKARNVLRERYFCERSCDVMELVWSIQDAQQQKRVAG